MTARAEKQREGRRATRLLPIFLSALIVLPNNPFVGSAAAQVFRAAEGASRAVAIGAAPAATGAAAVSQSVPSLPPSLSAPALSPSPWNPAGPTTLSPTTLAAAAPSPATHGSGTSGVSGLSGTPGPHDSGLPGQAPGAPARAGPAEKSSGASLSQARSASARAATAPDANLGAIFDGSKAEDPLGWKDVPPVPAGAPDSVAGISLAPAPGVRYTASPTDWRKEIIYSIILDRFARAEPHQSWGDPRSATSRHGGNIRGVIEKLDYLQGMGVTTLLINPLYLTLPSAYHNYWPLHFMAVDPHLGTMADMQEFVAAAHKRGMKIVLDMVFNHSGPVIEYNEGYKFSREPKTVKDWKYPLKPSELAEPENFHRRGSIDNWDDPEQMKHGDFPGGLNQLATERPETQDILLKIAKWWLQQTDVDGFRLDTYQHVDPSFWTRFFAETREYAAKLGKNNFLILGEIYHGDPRVLAPELGAGRLDAVFNYPAYFKNDEALHGEAPTSALEDGFNFVRSVLGGMIHRLVNFFDNQDKPRFLRAGDPVALSRVALAYTLMSVGIPFIYYGTEQAFRPAPSKTDLGLDAYREDMFQGGEFRSADSKGDDFNTESLLYKHLRELTAARAAHPALSVGEQYSRWSDPTGPGIHAFSRISGDEEVVVIVNTSGATRSAEMWVDAGLTPAGTKLTDELDRSYQVSAHAPGGGAGSKISVEVPPHGVRLMVRRPAAPAK